MSLLNENPTLSFFMLSLYHSAAETPEIDHEYQTRLSTLEARLKSKLDLISKEVDGDDDF